MKRELIIISLLVLSFLVISVSALDANITDTNATSNLTDTNQTNISVQAPLPHLLMKSINPSTFKLGDVQFNIQMYNQGNETLKNLVPLIQGPGFLTSNVIPIDELSPLSTGYILVVGHFDSAGTIPLTIKLNGQTFQQNLTITEQTIDQSTQSQLDQNLLQNLTIKLGQLKQSYTSLDQALSSKKADYDTSAVSLTDAKKYLRDSESNILSEDTTKAQVSLKLAEEELADQNNKLNNAPAISSFTKIKSNLVAISAVAGALITLFAAYELLKKKSTTVVTKVQEVKGKIAG